MLLRFALTQILSCAPQPEVVALAAEHSELGPLTRIKLRTADGHLLVQTIGEAGAPARESLSPMRARVSAALSRALRQHGDSGAPPIDVVLVLHSQHVPRIHTSSGGVRDEGRGRRFLVDGEPVGVAVADAQRHAEAAWAAGRRQRLLDLRREALGELADRHSWWGEPGLLRAWESGRATLRLSLTSRQIGAVIQEDSDLVVQLDLYEPPVDELSSALSSMGMTTWAHGAGLEGAGVGVYLYEAGGECPDASMMLDYSNLSGASSDSHADKVGNILARAAPAAHVYCGADYTDPAPATRTPPVYVSNHSYGWQSNDVSYRWMDREHDSAVYDDGVAVFKSAGNTWSGMQTPTVTSPGRGFNVITVGNYQDNNNRMRSSSLYGDPAPGNEKPEIAAPGTRIDTDAGSGTGTSYASPMAAAFAAVLMGDKTWLQGHPERLKANLMAGATLNIEGDARLSERDGAGALDFADTHTGDWNSYWSGPNGSHFDAAGDVWETRSLIAGARYRVALVWLVPPDYAFSHQALNMDLDLEVLDSAGALVAGSYSLTDSFEVLDFVASSDGDHDFRIHRTSNSGAGDVVMALDIREL